MYLEQEIPLINGTFELLFVENAGMAFGMSYGGETGKLILSLFRIAAVVFITVYLVKQLRKPQMPTGLIMSLSLILAGALGNIIDSAFYGMIFEESTLHGQNVARMFPPGGGYAAFLHGRVVDMLHLDLVTFTMPSWIPLLGDRHVNIFQPVFNLSDASITAGVLMILIGHRRYFRKHLAARPPSPAPSAGEGTELSGSETSSNTEAGSTPDSTSTHTRSE